MTSLTRQKRPRRPSAVLPARGRQRVGPRALVGGGGGAAGPLVGVVCVPRGVCLGGLPRRGGAFRVQRRRGGGEVGGGGAVVDRGPVQLLLNVQRADGTLYHCREEGRKLH